MKAKPVILPNSSEDPHIIYDQEAGQWRVLACSKGGAGFPATLYESDKWDGPYKIIAGPVNVNSTGCLLQKIGSKYYAMFGSSDHKFYVYSYPDLKQLGSLDMFRPPWDDSSNSRCWPNVHTASRWVSGPLLDRLTHHVHILEIMGDSYRLKSSLDKGKERQG